MFCTLPRLTRALVVSVIALSTAVGSLPDVICCCNISFGPAGLLSAAECKGPGAQVPPAGHQCSCCRKKSTRKNDEGVKVVSRGRTNCRFHLESNPEGIRASAESVVPPIAVLDFGLATPPVVLAEPTALVSDFVILPPQGNRGCALRQVWLI